MSRSIIYLVLIVFLLSGCSNEPAKKDVEKPADKPTQKKEPVELTFSEAETREAKLALDTAEVRHLPIRIDLAASVQPDETLTMPVSSLVPGCVEQVLVNLGDSVKQGQVLATVRSDEVGTIQTDFLQRLLDQRAESRQRLLELQAEARQANTQTEFLRKQYQRKKFLNENKIGSKAELESTESELQQAESSLEAAKAKEKAASEAAAAKEKALFITTKERLKLHGISAAEVDRVAADGVVKSLFHIRAPKNGVITTRDIDPGETTDANRHLFVITNLSRVWLIGQIFEKDLRLLSVGMPVTCTIESFPGDRFAGHLEYLGSKLDVQTRSLPIRASINNEGNKLRPDMFGHIIINVGTVKGITVRKEAIQTIGETPIVFVEKAQGTFEQRRVTPGKEIDDYVEIQQGLRPGERIVTTGSIDLLGKSLQSLSQ